jgi:DNA-binding CsgD family transcriptional regulator/PAS domain-containing protein
VTAKADAVGWTTRGCLTMLAGQDAEKLVELIYDAAIDNGLWREILTQIADLTASQGGILFGQSLRTQTVYFDFNGRLSEDCTKAYQERHFDNVFNRHMSHQPVGAIVYSDEIIELNDLRQTAFYDDIFRPQQLAHSAMIALASQNGFQAAFNICRTSRQGVFGKHERRLLSALVPHMRRSIALGLRSNAYQAVHRAAFEVIERLPDGFVVLDASLRTIYANPAARAFESGGALTLCPSPGCAEKALAEQLQRLLRNTARGAGGALSLPASAKNHDMLTLLATPVRGHIATRLHEASLRDAAVLVFIVDIARRRRIAVEQIRQAYGLTWSEARVAIGVGSGMSGIEVASAMNLSPNTVKSHLRNVFAKTATQRQSELARLVSALDSLHLCP